MADAASTARSMWTLFEPIHAVTYFAPQARSAYEQAGSRGFWRGWVGGDGELTSAGREARAAVENATDWAAARPWARLSPEAIGVPAPGAAG